MTSFYLKLNKIKNKTMAVFTVIQIYKVALQLNSSIYCKIKLLYDGECPYCAREVILQTFIIWDLSKR